MTILVGYIPTPLGDAALDRAVAEARARDDDLLVLNTSAADQLVDDRRVYDDQVEALRTRLEATGVRHEIRRTVRSKDVADEILDAAREVDADLIVIGLRRRSPTGKLLFGSTAQRVLLESDGDVLAVKLAE